MHRWNSSKIAIFFIAVFAFSISGVINFSSQVQAQPALRALPTTGLKYGLLEVTSPPEVLLSGERERLSPGARLRDPDNRLLLSASLVGRVLPVLYRREIYGLIHEVWVLRPDEAALMERARSERELAAAIDALRQRPPGGPQ